MSQVFIRHWFLAAARDRPEDSLDIRSVWEDVVKKVREAKSFRQFIFTTHNANIAVASDADKFHIFESSADDGDITHSGAIDRKEVKEAVVVHLEGGMNYTISDGKNIICSINFRQRLKT